MRELDVGVFKLDWTPLPSHKHRKWFTWSPARSGIAALLGGWGSGKSVTALRRYAVECLRRPWHRGYGRDNPTSVVMAPTSAVLKTATMPTLEQQIPPELILNKVKSPPYVWEWITGHVTLFFSAAGTIEGLNLTHFFMDEIQHDEYTTHPGRYSNMVARLRDPNCGLPYVGLVAGLPRHGQVRQWFDGAQPADTMCVQRVSALDNTYLAPGVVDALRAACTPDQVGCLIDGEWGSAPDAAFPTFDHSTHVVSYLGDRSKPVHVSIDLGRSGVLLVGQVVPTGLVLVDQLVSRDLGTDEVCDWFIKRGWLLTSESTVSIDPTSRIDEHRIIKRAFPNAKIVCRPASDPWRDEERGLKFLARCLRDGTGRVSLTISKALDGVAGGVIESLTHARANGSTGKMLRTRDSGLGSDHSIDALRYLVVTTLALSGRGPSIERLT